MAEQLNPDYISVVEDMDRFAAIFVVNDIRDESTGAIAAEKDILQASTLALMAMLTSEDEEVQTRVKNWTNGRIGKIVKRARGAAWSKVTDLTLPHFVAEHNGQKVMVFAPMRISEEPKEVRRLQVSGLSSPDESPMEYAEESYLLVKVNSALGMSTGKTVAQVGHAVQLFMMFADKEQVGHWRTSGAKVMVVKAENLAKEADAAIIVHDAGLTEIPSGSLTATAEYIQ